MSERRALLSVTDKTGLAEFAKTLSEVGLELVGSGGTKKHIEEVGLPIREVSDITNSPEVLGGRVKTLHPAVHGGILARRDQEDHLKTLDELGWAPIDVVVCNLYPFEKKVAEGADFDTLIENIDIGGVTLLRAAAKNHRDVLVLVDPTDYERVGEALKSGAVSDDLRRELALKAFAHTASYDTAITAGLSNVSSEESAWPKVFNLVGALRQPLRYGENPHQQAAFYVTDNGPESMGSLKQLHGKELSYNNIMDMDGAVGLVREFELPACAIIKHSNPCGCAVGTDLVEAHAAARACDPTSAFGGIIALNRTVTRALAEAIAPNFTEVVIAPAYDDDALEVLTQKKNIRLLQLPEARNTETTEFQVRHVRGGVLVQTPDLKMASRSEMKVVTEKQPTDRDWAGLEFAWKVVKWVKSNAIVYTSSHATLGIGAGQMSRVDSSKLGALKAKEQGLDLKGSYLGSDAFFPFRDGVDAAAAAGVSAIIQPGGSVRDDEVIEAANEHGMVMVFTGMRHFRH